MSRRVITSILSLLLAIGGGFLIFTYAKSADARALEGQTPATVYVSAAKIPSGTLLRDAQRDKLLVETQVADKAVPAGALQSIGDDNGALQAVTDIAPGEFILAARFGSTPLGTKAIEVPAGMLAVSVQLTDPARVGRFVTPGSHIAIYDSYKIAIIGEDKRSKQINDLNLKGTHVLLEDALVIGMGDTPLAAPASQPTTSTDTTKDANSAVNYLVTVAVTPAEATRLVHGAATGTLYAALRGTDAQVDDKSSTSDLSLFASTGGVKL